MNQAWIGLVGVFIVCSSQAIALPLVKRYKQIPAGQMLLARGLVSALLCAGIFAVVGHNPMDELNGTTLAVGGCFSIAAVGLYRAIKAWDVGLVITLIAATPIVNVAAAALRHRPVSLPALLTLPFLIAGVAMACRSDDATTTRRTSNGQRRTRKRQQQKKVRNRRAGIFWSIIGVLFNGLYYEALAESQFTSATTIPVLSERFLALLPLTFWQAVAVAVIGALMSSGERWTALTSGGKRLLLGLSGWAMLAGFCYFAGNILAFQGIDRQIASVLLQLETPAVIAAAAIIVAPADRERLGRRQWAGVALAILSGALLSRSIQ